MKKVLAVFVTTLITLGFSAQELTSEEQAFQDSINALNTASAATAESQEAYNNGIVLFSQEKYKEAVTAFDKSISGDSKFEAAYYNKGIAQ